MGIRKWNDPARVDDLGMGERRVLAFDENLMVVHYTFEKGATAAIHSHDAVTQSVYVTEGRIRFVGEYDDILEEGDTIVIPPGTEHGVEALERTELVDSFTPPIQEYTRKEYKPGGVLQVE